MLLRRNKALTELYFMYFFGALAPQILMISTKGSLFDTVYKALVLLLFLVGMINYTKRNDIKFLSKRNVFIALVFSVNALMGLLFGKVSISAIISTATIVIMLLFFFFVPYVAKITEGDLYRLSRYLTLFIDYACIFNLAFNGTRILSALSGRGNAYLSSFFDNQNTYGFFLFAGLFFVSLYARLQQKKSEAIVLLSQYLLIFFNLLLAASRTALLSSTIFVVIYTFLRSKHKLYYMLSFTVVACILIGLYIEVPWLNQYIDIFIFRKDSSLDERFFMNEVTMRAFSPIHYVFGYGEDAASYFSHYTYNAYFHNSFIALFATGGIVKLLIYISIIIHSLKCSLAIYKHWKALGAACMSVIIVYFIYSFGESVLIMDPDTQSMLATLAVVSIPSLINNSCKEWVGSV